MLDTRGANSLVRSTVLLSLLYSLLTLSLKAADSDPDALIEAGHWKRARAILAPRVESNPHDAQAVYLLSKVKMAFEDLDGALPLAQRAVALAGGKANYHYQLAVVYGEMADRAGLLGAARLVRKFTNELETALGLDPQNLDALDAKMLFCFRAPRLMGGDKNRARTLAEQISRLNPARGFLAQAELAQEENNAARIESLYLQAVSVDPQNYEARTRLADFYSSPFQKKYGLAIEHARRALQLDAGRVRGYSILAKTFALGQKWEDLDAILAAAVKHVPDDAAPFFEAADALLQTGRDLSRAEALLRTYLTREPEGEEPDTAHAHRLLGLVLERLGRGLEARRELETAVRMKPDFDAAKKDIQRIKTGGN